MIKSLVFKLGPSNEPKEILGHSGSSKLLDSKIPYISLTSGTFKDNISSWTLVPKAKLPCDKPSFNVVPPIPEALLVDFEITTFSDTFLIFVFDDILDLRRVAINFALPLARLNPTNVAVALEFVNFNLLESIAIVFPFVSIKVYLSSSKGKNTSLSSPVTALVSPPVMVTSNCLLITIEELPKSTYWTFSLGKTLYKLSLSASFPDPKLFCIRLPTNCRLDTSSCAWGTPPSTAPETLVTPTTLNELGLIPVTLLIVDNVLPGLLYLIKSPVLTIPTKLSPALVICETPAAAAPTVALPNSWIFLGIKSPVNVATPTLPYNDPISDIS